MSELEIIARLKPIAGRSLARMYSPDERLFVFRLRKDDAGRIVSEGLSRRYTAIAVIGLAGEGERLSRAALRGGSLIDVCRRFEADSPGVRNLGDAALTAWAVRAAGYSDRAWAWERLEALRPADLTYPVVELAWALAATCMVPASEAGDLRERLAGRLLSSFGPRSCMFPHVLGDHAGGFRSHVSCFADLVYPIHALSLYSVVSGDPAALKAASQCAERVCGLQGRAGQWWWHYDYRTGEVIEPYPVYAIHQDAMAPMALLALKSAGGPDFSGAVRKGLDWLAHSPELSGGSLVDEKEDIVWRKVARREPGKFCRYAQAAASRVHCALRVPGLDALFPPVSIDYEDRPYHLGWFLYAWGRECAAGPGIVSEERCCR